MSRWIRVQTSIFNHELFSDDQYEAALRFRTVRNEYRKALHSKGAYYEDVAGTGDYEAYRKWAEIAIRKHDDVIGLIRKAQQETRTQNLYAALEHVVIEDLPLDYMIGSVRIVCNLLNRHFMNVDRTEKVRNK